MIKAIIFDFWNTLFFKGVSFISVLADYLGVKDDYHIQRIVEESCMIEPCSDTIAAANKILRQFNIDSGEKTAVAVAAILSREWDAQPFEHTMPTLLLLKEKGYKLGIISNAYSPFFITVSKAFNLDTIFDAIVTSYDAGLLKPDPRIFLLALEKLAVKPIEALMVGDSLMDDIKGAESSGLKALLLDYKGKNPDYPKRITDIADIMNWLDKNA